MEGGQAAMSYPGDELDAWVTAAAQGERQALERVLTVVQPFVTRYCRARLGSRNSSYGSADDVAQEVCLAVITALPGYRDQGRPFLAFVYGIAANKVIDAFRSQQRDRSDPVSEVPDTIAVGAGPEQQAMNNALSKQMGQLLQILPPKQREILLLRVVLGLSAEETAQAMESTPGAVRVAQHRALTRLRGSLSPGELV